MKTKICDLAVPRDREIMERETIPTLKIVINKQQAHILANKLPHTLNGHPLKVLKKRVKFSVA